MDSKSASYRFKMWPPVHPMWHDALIYASLASMCHLVPATCHLIHTLLTGFKLWYYTTIWNTSWFPHFWLVLSFGAIWKFSHRSKFNSKLLSCFFSHNACFGQFLGSLELLYTQDLVSPLPIWNLFLDAQVVTACQWPFLQYCFHTYIHLIERNNAHAG